MLSSAHAGGAAPTCGFAARPQAGRRQGRASGRRQGARASGRARGRAGGGAPQRPRACDAPSRSKSRRSLPPPRSVTRPLPPPSPALYANSGYTLAARARRGRRAGGGGGVRWGVHVVGARPAALAAQRKRRRGPAARARDRSHAHLTASRHVGSVAMRTLVADAGMLSAAGPAADAAGVGGARGRRAPRHAAPRGAAAAAAPAPAARRQPLAAAGARPACMAAAGGDRPRLSATGMGAHRVTHNLAVVEG